MNKITNQKSSTYEVAIIGAGFSGLGAAIKLKMQGSKSFVIFERAKEVGGTWRENTYPGCACDIPSFLYSYSFEPNPNWSSTFSPQEEILDYLKYCVNKYDLDPHINYNTAITKLKFNEDKGNWSIWDNDGNETIARVVISAVGPFNAALIPNIKGKDTFQGESFHSLYWNHDYDLKGKKVAVIGTGASAIQFVPEIADQVQQMHIFQRTAPFIMPRENEVHTSKSKARFTKYPSYQKFWREVIYWFLELRGRSNFSKNWMRKLRTKECLEHLKNSISDTDLRKKLTPDYELGCKRVLVSSDYYPALEKSNVELIHEGVQEIVPNGIKRKSGEIIELDAIIYGTGFHAASFKDVPEVIGRNQKNLFDDWNTNGGECYLGTAVSGLPNLFFVVGPNTGLGHNSIIHMMESQYNYIFDYLKNLRKTPDTNTFYDLKLDVQQKYNEDIQEKLIDMVWNEGGCSSYYLKDGNGKNTSIWPGSTMSFRKATKQVNIKNYNIITPKVSELEIVE